MVDLRAGVPLQPGQVGQIGQHDLALADRPRVGEAIGELLGGGSPFVKVTTQGGCNQKRRCRLPDQVLGGEFLGGLVGRSGVMGDRLGIALAGGNGGTPQAEQRQRLPGTGQMNHAIGLAGNSFGPVHIPGGQQEAQQAHNHIGLQVGRTTGGGDFHCLIQQPDRFSRVTAKFPLALGQSSKAEHHPFLVTNPAKDGHIALKDVNGLLRATGGRPAHRHGVVNPSRASGRSERFPGLASQTFEALARGRIPLLTGQSGSPQGCPGDRIGIVGRLGLDGAFDGGKGGRGSTVHEPEGPAGNRHPNDQVVTFRLAAPRQGCLHIRFVVFHVRPAQRTGWTGSRIGFFGHGDQMESVGQASLVEFAAFDQALASKLPDGFEHVGHALASLPAPGRQAVRNEDIDEMNSGRPDHGLDGSFVGAADKHGEMAEGPPGGRIQQAIAPVDGGLKRALTWRQILRAVADQTQPHRNLLQDCGR